MTGFTSPALRDGADTERDRGPRGRKTRAEQPPAIRGGRGLLAELAHAAVRRARSLGRWAAWNAMISAAVFAGQAETLAADSPGKSGDTGQPGSVYQPEARTVRLSFFNQTWESVLQSVADDSGSTLIKLDLPPGRITRRDRHHYTRDEAVAILNGELEKQNFRIMAKDQFLAVVHRQRATSNYRPRANAAEPHAGQQWQPQADMSGGVADPVHSATRTLEASGSLPPTDEAAPQRPRREVHTIVARPPRQPEKWDEPMHAAPHDAPAVQTVAHQESGPRGTGARGASGSDPADPAAARGEAPRPVERPITTVLRTERPAADVARFVFDSLKDRSELLEEGPEGLPAFRVYRTPRVKGATSRPGAGGARATPTATEGPRDVARSATNVSAPVNAADVHFEVGIDVERNELVLAAGPSEIRGLADLLRKVDAARGVPGQAIRLVAGGRDSDRLVTRLRPALKTMVAQRNANTQPVNQPEPNQPFPGVQPPVPPGLPMRDDFPAAGVRGDVEIEVLPGGLLLLRGNLEDVEAVQNLLQQIQELARGTVPEIELLMLRHVQSEAMAALLTQVYDTLNNLRGRGVDLPQTVAFIPVVKPNAILILAPRVELDSILRLASELDQPVDPGTEFEVFRLRNAIASQVAQTITNAYVAERPGLAPRVQVFPDARTNALIVRARPRDMAEIALLVSRLDSDRPDAVTQMRVFELQNAVAEELLPVIRAAIQAVLGAPPTPPDVGPVATEFQAAKSAAIEFLTTDGEAVRLVRSGVLADIRVTADPRLNSLIVTASEDSLRMMAVLIRRLDQPTPLVADIKVFTLENSDAQAMAELLNVLFATPAAQQLGVQVATAADASSGLIPLRFAVDIRTNSVIAVGAADALRVVEAILLRLDQTDIRQRQNAVVRLRNTPAAEIGFAINQLLQAQRDLYAIDPNLITAVELLEREVIAVPEPVSNSIIISATPRFFADIRALIERLDAAPPQVIIQALLVEVDLTNTDELGVELGFQDDVLFSRGMTLGEDLLTISETFVGPNQVAQTTQRIISQAATPGFAFNNQPLGRNIAASPSSVGTQGLSNFSLGRTNAELGFGGLVLSASSAQVSVLIRALSARRTVHVLSRPQITTLDNQAALIQVGQDVPQVSAPQITQIGTIGPLGTTGFRNVGIILEVIPRITPDDNIVMEVIATKSSISAQSVPLFTDPQTGVTVESPIFNITTARSTLSVPNGQTIVMGGMITKEDNTLERKVPWLGDIPWIGSAFRYDSTATRRTELLIFLTPRIIRSDGDFELIKQVETERLHFVEEDAELLHGPLFSVPPMGAGPRGGFGYGFGFDGFGPDGCGPEGCPPGVPGVPGLPGGMPVPMSPGTIVPPSPSAPGVPPVGQPLPMQPLPPGSQPVPPGYVPTTIMPPQGAVEREGASHSLYGTDADWSTAWDPVPGRTHVAAQAPPPQEPRKRPFLSRVMPGKK